VDDVTVLKASEFSLNPPGGRVCYLLNGSETESGLLTPHDVFDSANGIKVLNPIQTVFARHYLYGNALVAAPTSAGKSLIALIFLLRHNSSGGSFLYVSPTRSLAVQSSRNFVPYFNVVLKLSGYDDTPLSYDSERATLIVTTYEACVTALRNRVSWARNASAIVIDEFHQISSSDRGILIEELTAWAIFSRVPLLGLSATLPGGRSVANWLDVTLYVESFWRPVPLERTFVPFYKKDKTDLLTHLISPEEKTIIFVGSKKEGWHLLSELYNLGYEPINKTLPDPLPNVYRLYNAGFCAFHCADVPVEEQQIIESRFKEDADFRVLIATQTLAYGMNMPVDHVVIFLGKKYIQGKHLIWPTPSDVLQMEGRAGRLGLRDRGRSSICLTGHSFTHYEIKRFIEKFYQGKFTTSLAERMEEDKDTLYLMILASMIYTKDPVKFLRCTWALSGKYLLYDVFKSELVKAGFIYGDKLSPKGLFAVQSGVTPAKVNRFLDLFTIDKGSLITLTPFLKDGLSVVSTGFIKEEEIKRILIHYPWFTEDVDTLAGKFRFLVGGFNAVEWSIIAYQSGVFFYKPALHNLPGGFGRFYQDREYVIKTLLLSKSLGLTDYTTDEVVELIEQLESGLPCGWAYFGGIKGVGYFYGHALRLALRECGVGPPERGLRVGEYFSRARDLRKVLREVFLAVGRADRSEFVLKAIEDSQDEVFKTSEAIRRDVARLEHFINNRRFYDS